MSNFGAHILTQIEGNPLRNPFVVTRAMSPYTILDNDHEILCDTASGAGGNIVLNFPEITALNDGREIIVKFFTFGAGTIVLCRPSGTQTMEDNLFIMLTLPKQSVTLGAHFAATDWWIK